MFGEKTAAGTRSKRRWQRLTLTISGAAIAAIAVASTASAATGVWKDIPNYGSSDGEAILDDVDVGSGEFWGRVKFNRVGGSYCTYIQAKGVTILGLDSLWFRLTPNRCSSTSTKVGYSFYKNFAPAYNGMAFRICGDKALATDPCGAAVTIYN
jgi:hypothetical protein